MYRTRLQRLVSSSRVVPLVPMTVGTSEDKFFLHPLWMCPHESCSSKYLPVGARMQTRPPWLTSLLMSAIAIIHDKNQPTVCMCHHHQND